MGRKRSPSSEALAKLPGAGGGVEALQDRLLVRAGYDAKLQAQITRDVVERARARAAGATKVQRLVVADGRGRSHVEEFVDADEALRQRADEFLADQLGLAPSRSQTVAVQNNLTVVITKREPPTTFVEETVVDAEVQR